MIVESIVVGVVATATMDTSSAVGTKLGYLRKPNVSLLGRWTFEILHGHLKQDIRSAPARRYERELGFLLHYAIGISLAALFLMIGRYGLGNGPALGIAFGLSTNVFPWFLMFPSMGFGFLGDRSPPEALLFRTSLVAHLVYGLGLWLGCLFLL